MTIFNYKTGQVTTEEPFQAFVQQLILKAPITTAADDNLLFYFFSEKTSLDISCESSAKQMIHMKCQDLFSLKNKKNFF